MDVYEYERIWYVLRTRRKSRPPLVFDTKRKNADNARGKKDKTKTKVVKLTHKSYSFRTWVSWYEKQAVAQVWFSEKRLDGTISTKRPQCFSADYFGGRNHNGVDKAIQAANKFQEEWVDEKGLLIDGAPRGVDAAVAFGGTVSEARRRKGLFTSKWKQGS